MKLDLLAFETSSSRCGVALLRLAGGLPDAARPGSVQPEVIQIEHDGSQEHAERLLPMASELLARAGLTPADLDAVAFGQGPGGFTGLRVACGVAQGVALGLGVPVVPVVSHLAVAEDAQAGPDDAVLVALDARMEEVYLAVYARESSSNDERDNARGPSSEAARHPSLADTREPASNDALDLAGGRTWRVLQAPMLIAAGEVLPWARHQLPAWSREAGRELTLLLAGDAWQVYPEVMSAESESHESAFASAAAFTATVAAASASASAPSSTSAPASMLASEPRQAPLGRPRAATVARLAWQAWRRGAALPPEEAAPLYVRDKVAFTTAERAGGLGGNPRAGRALPADGGALQADAHARKAMVLKAMTLADVDEVTALESQVQAFPWTRGNFEDAIEAGYPACVLRQDDHRLAGFCVLMPAPDVAHLLVIAVAGELQQRGLGRRLVDDWCQEQAARAGAEGILLEVRRSNARARRFYEKLGFVQIGVRKGYYPAADGREDALVLRRDVVTQGQGDVMGREPDGTEQKRDVVKKNHDAMEQKRHEMTQQGGALTGGGQA